MTLESILGFLSSKVGRRRQISVLSWKYWETASRLEKEVTE
ncbi:hypothetical protein NC651_021611 [Populus alba x Populus x berolinensis]|nr:hypothetical protein NC651_021611 [Populus alba x Populus x berolinensis]